MLRTRLCDLLEIDLPIVQAPVGSASCPELAAAVSNAGALGMLSGTWRDPDLLRTLIRRTRALTTKPFGVNLVLAWPMQKHVDVCLDEGVGIVSLFWGDPAPFVKPIHDAGAIVLSTATSAADARRAVDVGVDIIVAQGCEAGGHVRGDVGTIALVPAIVDAVPRTPVIAAGGIGDGRGIAAALALGADGAWLGTRFLLAAEARLHHRYRERLIDALETDTVMTTCFDGGWPDAAHRVLRNSTLDNWEAAGSPGPGERPGEGEKVARYPDGETVARYSSDLPRPDALGDIDDMCLYAGQSVGLVNGPVVGAAMVVQALADETRTALKRLAGGQ